MAFRFETANERWKWFKRADWQDEPSVSWEEMGQELGDVEQAIRVQELVNEVAENLKPILGENLLPINDETADAISYAAAIASVTIEQWPTQPGDWLVTAFGSKPADEAKQMILGNLDRLDYLAKIAASPEAEYRPEGWGDDEPYFPDYDPYYESEYEEDDWDYDPVKSASDRRVYEEYRNVLNNIIMFVSGNAWRNVQIEYKKGENDDNAI